MTVSQADWLDCVASEIERTAGSVDRDKLAAEMYGDGDYDMNDGPFADEFEAWAADREAEEAEANDLAEQIGF